MSTPAITPDFIPAPQGQSNAPDFIPVPSASSPSAQPQDQGSAFMRFLKGAASRAYGATAGAGPQQGTAISYGSPEWQQAEQAAMSGHAPSALQIISRGISDASLSNANVGREVAPLNPISPKFSEGDTAGGMGETAMNLIMLRQALNQVRGKTAEFGEPRNFAEKVTPIDSYTKAAPAKPQLLLPSGGIPLPAAAEEAIPSTVRAQKILVRDPATGKIKLMYGSAPDSGSTYYQVQNQVASQTQPAYNAPAPENPTFFQPETSSVNRTASGNPQRSNVVKNQAQLSPTPRESPQPTVAYRMRDAGETGIMPNAGKHPQASVDPQQVANYGEFREQAQNHPQEMVKIDLTKLDPSEYTVHSNGYVQFHSAVPEAFIEKMPVGVPRVPTSGADMLDLLRQSLAKAGKVPPP